MIYNIYILKLYEDLNASIQLKMLNIYILNNPYVILSLLQFIFISMISMSIIEFDFSV